jgi:RecA/RadA recombinase
LSRNARSAEEKGAMSLGYALDLAKRRSVFSSGSKAVDGLLGGGFRTGETVEVFGASNTGKTQLAMQSTLDPVSQGYTAAFIDTEGTFRPERLARMAENRGMDPDRVLSRVFFVRAESTVQQREALRTSQKLEACKFVAIDTITKNFSLEYGGTKMAARRQAALGAHLNRLSWDAFAHDRAIILTNRVASVGDPATGTANREVDIGGETLRHAVQKVLHLQRRGDLVHASLLGPEARAVDTRISEIGME